MDTNKIKRFATEARTKLKEGIKLKIKMLGFGRDGNVPENLRPKLMQGGTLWNGQIQTEGFYHYWTALFNRVQEKGINEVYEEAAYTWFNRLCAIRILQKNNLCEPVLDYSDFVRTPRIVDEARLGRIPQMNDEQKNRLTELLDDDTKVTEQFAVLITAWCHSNPIINKCFGGMEDYTELLLPSNILAEGGFIDMLNHTDFITDENYTSPELIGWLYQFYISERKDEVFAKKGKFEADEIPAATQIFTPNWIVKYMVQNTIGRIYLDNHPEEKAIAENWKYLVDPNQNPNILRFGELTELKVGDLACGSGHILNEMFDLLYDLYLYEGYGRSEAIENIFGKNLIGIDIDTRAKQLATFALLLKACQKDVGFADAHCLPKVLDMPKPVIALNVFFGGFMHDMAHSSGIVDAVELCGNADSLGSIMKFDITEQDRKDLQFCIDRWQDEHNISDFNNDPNDVKVAELILALTDKYHALVMNPPYMGGGNMNEVLSKYVKDNYEIGKADLCTVFMMMQAENVVNKGYYASITPPSWMFLSTFEGLRKNIIENNSISSLLHLSRGVFGADFGSVSCVIQNTENPNSKGTYFRLIERTFQEFDQKHLQQLFEKTLENHNFKYYFADYTKEVSCIEYSEKGSKIYYPNVEQKNFEKIPGCPMGYWVSEKMFMAFDNNSLEFVCKPKKGLDTPPNDYYLKLWYELSFPKIGIGFCNDSDFIESGCKYAPITKGGGYRKWYGKNDYVIIWGNNGEEVRKNPMANIRNEQYYFEESLTWTDISSGAPSFRYNECGFIPNVAGPCVFDLNDKGNYIIGLLNSRPVEAILKITAPTMHFNVGAIASLPYINSYLYLDDIESLCKDNISISRLDWDAHETSWDFKRNELIEQQLECILDEMQNVIPPTFTTDDAMQYWTPSMLQPLYILCANYRQRWEDYFYALHRNEEELNRQFIEIYGLQDELTPDVPLEEITILQQGEISIVNDKIVWHDDVIMKQLISYAVGCMMGRYRLDKPGLHIAHPEPTDKETAPYMFNGESYEIDDDGIIPLMTNDCGFSDNAATRFSEFVRIVFGGANHIRNLNYVEKCLGKTVEQYFVKDFWKDHKKMYQNRPIYWLFSSSKGAFQVIAYMHRMNAYTVERVWSKYLLPYIEHLRQIIADLESRMNKLNTNEMKRLKQLRINLEECVEYHERLQVVAEQAVSFDLDDGVVVNYAKFGDVVAKIK